MTSKLTGYNRTTPLFIFSSIQKLNYCKMGSFFPLSAFADLSPPPGDEQLNLSKLHDADTYDKKVNLITEEYKDRNGEPWILPVVRQVGIKFK
jgi:hypothetical protein